jgi:hypothetical protein
MTSKPSRSPMPVLALLAALVGLGAAPTQARAQLRSSVASIALVAYSAPAVHLGASPLVDRAPDRQAAPSLEGMTVNTGYRVELRSVGASPVVLLRQERAGLVPWNQIRAGLATPADAPVLLDLILAPTL